MGRGNETVTACSKRWPIPCMAPSTCSTCVRAFIRLTQSCSMLIRALKRRDVDSGAEAPRFPLVIETVQRDLRLHLLGYDPIERKLTANTQQANRCIVPGHRSQMLRGAKIKHVDARVPEPVGGGVRLVAAP